VALTRARDRLYLSAIVQNGGCRTTRGSLGEVLPKTLIALFSQTGGSQVAWAATSGRTHRLRCVAQDLGLKAQAGFSISRLEP